MKAALIRVISFCMYYLGVDSLFYWLNRKAKRILTFHNVLPDELWFPAANGVSNKASDFERIVREVGRKYKFSTDVLDGSTATITFDDGYLNQYEIAGGILGSMGISAIIFVAGDNMSAIDQNQSLVVDQLLHWCGHAPKELVNTANRIEHWVKVVRPQFVMDKASKGRTVLKQLDELYPFAKIWEGLPKEYLRLRLTGIPADKLEELKKRGWEIGYHTKSHFPLSSLPDAEIRKEIEPPPGFRDVVFSYPYGELRSVDGRCIDCAKKCGYPCAVSNLPSANSLTGRYFLPRMSLPADKYRLHFRLSGLEHFVKTRKLLPMVGG